MSYHILLKESWCILFLLVLHKVIHLTCLCLSIMKKVPYIKVLYIVLHLTIFIRLTNFPDQYTCLYLRLAQYIHSLPLSYSLWSPNLREKSLFKCVLTHIMVPFLHQCLSAPLELLFRSDEYAWHPHNIIDLIELCASDDCGIITNVCLKVFSALIHLTDFCFIFSLEGT